MSKSPDLKIRPPLSGQLMPTDFQEALLKGRQKATIARLRVDASWFAVIAIGLLILVFFFGMQWKKAEQKFEKNVRVTYVKLSPTGDYSIDYEKEEQRDPKYFARGVQSKLTEWIQKRYSKRAETIQSDYGFANAMMSPSLSTEFTTEYKASTVAAKHAACAECPQEEVIVRAPMKDLDDNLAPNSTEDRQYSVLFFALRRTTNKDHQLLGCKNLMITVLWHLRPISEVVKKRDELNMNPLGQEIMRSEVQEDPSPISIEECRKRSY